MVTQPEKAVFHSSPHGPTFGAGSDLAVSNSSNTNRSSYIKLSSFEYPNGLSGNEGGRFIVGCADNWFQTVEIEIFEVL